MPDFTDNDLRAIERDRDLPPDQPPYDWADPELWDAEECDEDDVT